MKQFPVTIVDNFYENPDFVRDYALSLEYEKSGDGKWPGVRSKHLNEINQNFFKMFNTKLFSLFFDFDKVEVNWDVDVRFQKVCKFSSDKEDIKNFGWIHYDPKCIFAGVVYLNPDDHLYSGTSVYKLKPGEKNTCNQKTKFLHYSESKHFDEEEHKIEKTTHNNKFIETIRIENVYNRLVLFEEGVFHGVPNFHSESDDPRLTLVFFVNELRSSSLSPILRSKTFHDYL